MGGIKYLNFLILGAILCHSIDGTSLENNIQNSSDFHVRQKRVINYEHGGNSAVSIKDVPYVVGLQKFGVIVCVGSILSHHVIITAAHCVPDIVSVYKISSSSANAHLGIIHDVLSKIIHHEYNSEIVSNDIALLKINPRIEYSILSHYIQLNTLPILHGTEGVVSGWGSHEMIGSGSECSDYLRSISVPILTRDECMRIYQSHHIIPERYICTFHESGQRMCAIKDSGAPLVVNFRLVGVLSGRGIIKERHTPDVFVNVSAPEYVSWINSNIHIIESQMTGNQYHYDLHHLTHKFDNPHNFRRS